jgi:hypothetical protein
MTDTPTFADIFEAAADVVATSWQQGDYYGLYSNGPRYCAIGALGVACGQHVDVTWVPGDDDCEDLVSTAASIAAQYLVTHTEVPAMVQENGTDIIVNWNDDPETTQDQVADTFRRVAKDLRNEAKP